ncbi:MAG: hypothetical protein QOK37_2965 [Thermoanaerobaculia bacterium]|jgi:hypothetical protein|nr:hypothetical protein [Thermoanaerobaculia bacterium]
MRRLACAAAFLFVCPIALAQHFHHATAPDPADTERNSPCTKPLIAADPPPDVDKVYWPVTGNSAALPYFRRGITEYYGFNFEEALLYFRIAKQKDPSMAMASWGIALAAGPNINLGMDARCRALAVSELTCALALAKPQSVTPVERGLIDALALRYAGPVPNTVAYAVAMRNMWDLAAAEKYDWDTRQASDDQKRAASAVMANVGALYAESMLDMRPWGLFDAAYRPALDTKTVIDVLKDSMVAEPKAIGANHFWIHTAEASEHPEEAYASAKLLNYAVPGSEQAVPGSGHLLHMPSHIYLLTGEYARAMASNTDAVHRDREQYEVPCRGWYSDYTQNLHCPQLYYGHYLSHNLFFRAVSAAFGGQSAESVKSACETREHAAHFLANEPGLQRYMTAPLMTMVMNRNWTSILAQAEPAELCYMAPFGPPKYPLNGCHIYDATLHWAKGMAYVAGGRAGLEQARVEYAEMAKQMDKIVPPTPTGWGNNTAAAVLSVSQSKLQALLIWQGGGLCGPCAPCGTAGQCEKHDPCENHCLECASAEQAIEHLKLAVTHEDALVYDEPPQLFPPAREALGGSYLRQANGYASMVYPERREPWATKAREMYEMALIPFEEEIGRHRASGRPLYGKMRALEGIRRFQVKERVTEDDVNNAKDAFCKAWGDADYTMSLDELWPSASVTDGDHPYVCPGKEQLPKRPADAPSDCKLPPPPAS